MVLYKNDMKGVMLLRTKFLFILIASIVTVLVLTTRVVQISTGNKTFYPKETGSILNNPFMGWVPWANGGPYSQPHRLVYINASWSELEPVKGEYAFEALETENKFAYWRAAGVKIILRINMDYPGPTPHINIPAWLYEEIKGDGVRYELPYGKGFSPNYSNPKLIFYHRKLIDALALRYNDDDLIPMVAIGSMGHWGEFHTWKSFTFTIPFPPRSISDQYVNHYVKAFTNKFLLMRRPFQIALNNQMGLYNDSFGDFNQTYNLFIDYLRNGYLDRFTGETHPSMSDFWMSSPSGGEFADYPGTVYVQNNRISETLKQVSDSHVSWLGPSFPVDEPFEGDLQKNLNRIHNKLGYRFVLKSIRYKEFAVSGQNLPIEISWENKGSAPFYYNWPVELSLSDAEGNIVASILTDDDIRKWLPGKATTSQGLQIPEKLPTGIYDLCIAILDPATNKPGIDLAIEGKRPDGRYKLDSVFIFNNEVSDRIFHF